MVYSSAARRYVQVKNSAKYPDIAYKFIMVSTQSDYEETWQKAILEFFPRGRSIKGKESTFELFTGKKQG